VIRKPTVLILGAGASAPYGYALGEGLVSHILGLTKQGGQLRTVLTSGGYSMEQVEEFRKSLQDGKPASIDDFLEANGEFAELGRVCIAAALTVFGPRTEEPQKSEEDWLKYVWWRLHNDAPTSKKFAGNRLKIVTFNYDTSFERYLASVLSFYPDFRKDRAAAEAFRAEIIPTVHIHGSLGLFIEELRSMNDPIQRNLITWYKGAANAIRILNEGEHAVEYSLAHEWIREADVIYFLGFGYHQTNTTRLDLRGQIQATIPGHPDRIVKGTALRVGKAEREDIDRRLNVPADVISRSGGVLYPLDARAFLETHGLA